LGLFFLAPGKHRNSQDHIHQKQLPNRLPASADRQADVDEIAKHFCADIYFNLHSTQDNDLKIK